MDGAYQPTTERTTSTSEDVRCSLRSIWPRLRQRDYAEDEEEDEMPRPKKTKKLKRDSYSQICTPLPCVTSVQSSNGNKRSPSNVSLSSRESTLEREPPEKPTTVATGSKWNVVRSKIKKGTEEFFCLCEDEKEKQLLQQKWLARRKRHCSKIYGQLVQHDVDGDATPRFASISSSRSHQTIFNVGTGLPQRPVLQRTKSRKESVAAMAWQTLKMRITGGDFPASLSNGDMIGKGRSFAPATLAHLAQDEEDVFDEPTSPRSLRDVDDEVFFDFISGAPATTPASLPPIVEDDETDAVDAAQRLGLTWPLDRGSREHRKATTSTAYEDVSPAITVCPELPSELKDRESPPQLPAKTKIRKPLEEERTPLPVGDVPTVRPKHPPLSRQISTASQRGARMIRPPQPRVVRANRRQIGKGLVGRWLNRTIKRRRLTSAIKKQMDDLEDHRPYFTYWISFVQTAILIITLAVYGFAPVGFSVTEEVATVHRSRGGYLVPENEKAEFPDNFWIGPSRHALIQLGAKYAPCMRKDKELMRYLEKERKVEEETGCCIGTDQNGCIQTSSENCKKTFSTLKKYTAGNQSRAVCGQDPATCTNPPSVEPNKWPPYKITEWPICKEVTSNTRPAEAPHLHCKITGRPCCIGDQAVCRIVSKEYCDFMKGVYHDEATLCSQVDCLGATCGLLPFLNPESPDQIYRLWLSLFLHAGIFHLLITLIFHFTILKDMEKMAGWHRITIIYLFSGIGGNLLSAIITPYQPEVGPSGALFGIIACLLVELIQNWQIIKKPLESVLKLLLLTLLLLLVGCFPWVDNFAHLGGLMFGTLLGFAFLPYLTFGKWDRRRKIIQIVVSLGLTIAIFVSLCIVFFVDQETTCSGCHYLNCIPFTDDFCSPAIKGGGLDPRTS